MNAKKTNTELSTRAGQSPLPLEDVRSRIVLIRQSPVILDADVAELYGVETKRVNEAVRNNPDKFPQDYMFVLDEEESRALRSKISSLKPSGKGRHSKYNYKAFTEKGRKIKHTVRRIRKAEPKNENQNPQKEPSHE